MSEIALVTGSSGFIGYHMSKALLESGTNVIGIDNMNEYYPLIHKENRLQILKEYPNFNFFEIDITNLDELKKIVDGSSIDYVFHFAAQAGVKYSLENPKEYIYSNIFGSFNLLECIKNKKIKHALFASSSSIYGANQYLPYKEDEKCDHQLSVYGTTKKSMENLAYTYSHLYRQPITCFRFFTVYGPYMRPDLALFKFTEKIMNKKKIEIYNNGNMKRDFTYISDLIECLMMLKDKAPNKITGMNESFYNVVNIGSGKPVNLIVFLKLLEKELNLEASIEYAPNQIEELKNTEASLVKLEKIIGKVPYTPLEKGVKFFIEWYKDYNMYN